MAQQARLPRAVQRLHGLDHRRAVLHRQRPLAHDLDVAQHAWRVQVGNGAVAVGDVEAIGVDVAHAAHTVVARPQLGQQGFDEAFAQHHDVAVQKQRHAAQAQVLHRPGHARAVVDVAAHGMQRDARDAVADGADLGRKRRLRAIDHVHRVAVEAPQRLKHALEQGRRVVRHADHRDGVDVHECPCEFRPWPARWLAQAT